MFSIFDRVEYGSDVVAVLAETAVRLVEQVNLLMVLVVLFLA